MWKGHCLWIRSLGCRGRAVASGFERGIVGKGRCHRIQSLGHRGKSTPFGFGHGEIGKYDIDGLPQLRLDIGTVAPAAEGSGGIRDGERGRSKRGGRAAVEKWGDGWLLRSGGVFALFFY